MRNIKTELIHFTPSKVLVLAAGIPHNNPNADEELVSKIIVGRDHGSVSEHMVFNFMIDGVTRAFLQELVRHRIASYTVESTRYILHKLLNKLREVPHAEIPDEILEKAFGSPNLDELWEIFQDEHALRNVLFKLKMHNLKCLAIMERMSNAGVPADIYKYFLNENFKTRVLWTINLRSMLNFLRLRTDKSAHFEIRLVANLVRAQLCRIPLVRDIIKGKEEKWQS